jgi:hypothetical protein
MPSDGAAVWTAPNDRHPRDGGRNLLEQLQPFGAHAELEIGKASGVAAGARQTVHVAGADRIDDGHKHDRHGAGRPQHGRRSRGSNRQNCVGRERGQFGGLLANAVGVAGASAIVDPHIAVGSPAQLLQSLREGRDPR